MKRQDCINLFLRGYIDAALFTTDPCPPSGQDYVDSGRSEDCFPHLPDWWIEEAKSSCEKFMVKHHEMLAKAGDDWQNGADFWYTRNGHGVGFWDRGYDHDVADYLTAAAGNCGEHYLMAEDFGLVSET